MRLVRFICAAYWPLLTVLLLVPDPLALFGIRRVPSVSKGMGVHFLCFSVLGFLVLAAIACPPANRRAAGPHRKPARPGCRSDHLVDRAEAPVSKAERQAVKETGGRSGRESVVDRPAGTGYLPNAG